MYESLTCFIPVLSSRDDDGDCSDCKNADNQGLDYGVVSRLEDEIYTFVEKHPEQELRQYGAILEESGIEWGVDSMVGADPSALDGRTCIALLLGAVRAEHFCGGALISFLEAGSIQSWLERLEEIDQGDCR